MTMITANLPVLVVIAPLFVACILPTLASRKTTVENLVVLVELLGLAGALGLAWIFLMQQTPILYHLGGWPPPWGIRLVVDHLTIFFLLVTAIVALPVALFARDNLAHEVGSKGRIARFYVLYLLLHGALAGMAVTNDLFNVYVLVEVATLSCCGLVSSRNHPRAANAAFTYLIMATLGSALVLGGIALVYINTGHLNMAYAAEELALVWESSPRVIWVAASLFLTGFAVKAALFPLHVWLPEAHATAPTPASAVLSGLAVKGYLLCLLKILYTVFGPTLVRGFAIHKILTLVSVLAILVGSILALKEDELKRRLAFSTVAQMGYILAGLGFANVKGLAGSLFYLASHGVIKSALFLAAGTIIKATGKERISELAGIGQKMPLTMAVFSTASLGLVGLPLFSGFVGKWHLLLGSWEGNHPVASAVIVAGSVLCAAYLFPILRNAYFEPAPEEISTKQWRDPKGAQRLALVLLATAIVILGIFPRPLLDLAYQAAAELLRIR
ncbi:MAG: complex I subunit 5 family protein [Limnochordia bacterium]|jgi:multicomponent Na+:H+ antiporter subunit D